LELKKLIARHVEDCSDQTTFRFRIRCEACGGAFESRPVRFSKAEAIPETPEKKLIYETMRQQELEFGRECAMSELAEHMNVCPVCKRMVCNSCFLICEDLDICVDCAAKLNETGVPVITSDSAAGFVPA